MPNNAREVFAQIPTESRRPEFEGWRGSYKFVVDGQGVWHANVNDGVVEVHEGDVATDCAIRCDNEDFMRIFSGEQNLMTAWMQGRIEAEGDLALLQRFHGFIRAGERLSEEGAR